MIGQTVGKYQVIERIGRGGMGTVYRAMDETLRREVAIKVLNAELNDPEVARRFRAEAVTVARLSHPGIATIYELFEHDGQWLMVMEFVRGETLEHLVERMGPLSPQRAAELCMQALTALAHAHSLGVIHRDLKPANMMITESGTVKVMDFGIARVSGSEHLTNAGFMMGTPAYMSPEQVLGNEIDARADLYSMGVVFFRLTTAKLPFRGDTPFAMAQSQVNDPPTPLATLRTDLPSWADQITTRALSKAKEDRFQSAVEFYEAFSRCLAGLPLTTLYNPSAPTELLLTPPRAMPTGSYAPSTGTGSGQQPVLGTNVNMTVAPSPSGVIQAASSGARAMAGAASGAVPASGSGSWSGVSPQPSGVSSTGIPVQTGATATETAPAQGTQPVAVPKKSNVAVIAAAALILVIGGTALVFWIKSRQPVPASAPPVDPSATAATASPAVTPDPAAAPPGEQPPAGGLNDAGRGTATGLAARGTPAASPTPGAGRADAGATGRGTPGGAASTSTSPTPTPATAPSTPASDEHVAYSDIKLLLVNGKKGQNQDVVMNFVAGQISVTPKNGGTPLKAVPYKSLLHATYSRSKDPLSQTDPGAPSPPTGLDLPGLFRGARHWLVLQTKGDYLILQLDDANFAKVLETVEGRTGVKVDRRPASK